ncbi:MAG TPA: ParA family protein [Chloroflexota bacterium]|nr:ParA family protein [Chloroflexota bacterium]
MPSLTITNQKGGVGKTTTTLNLAAALQELGVRVLLVDFDPQGSLTASCGFSDPAELGAGQTIADALLTTMRQPVAKPISIEDVIVSTRAGVDLVPSNQELAAAERNLYAVYGREFALRDTLAPVKAKYDLIFIDSVPTLGLLAINSLAAADGLVIPVQAEFLAVHGLAQLLDSVQQVRNRLNPTLQIWGVALTMVDGRTKHSHDIIQLVRENLVGQVPVFKTEIPVDVRLKESSRAGMTVLRLDPRARSSRAYRELAKEIAIMVPAARVAPSREPLVPNRASALLNERASTPVLGNGTRNSVTATSDGVVTLPREPVLATAPAANRPTPGPAVPRLPGICPYLGLSSNPSAHCPEPTLDHRCFVANPPLQIPEREQHLTCLTQQHTGCDRFFRATLNSVPPPTAPIQEDAQEPTPVFARFRKIVFQGYQAVHGSDGK